MWRSILLLAVAAASPQWAAAADALWTRECRLALDRLEQMESAAMPARGAPTPDSGQRRQALEAVKDQQRKTAVACRLDTDPPQPPASARVREPMRASPFTGPSAAPARPQLGAPPPEAVRAPQTFTLSACDDQGCWTSDGRRLSRAGALLIGPTGLCSQHGTLLRCP
jgi:hypothetical protein